MMKNTTWHQVKHYRNYIYVSFQQEADALMNLVDALLTQERARSLAELSLTPAFERKWPSIYTALKRGRIDREWLHHTFVKFLPAVAPRERLLLAGDASSIPRPEAKTSPDRMTVHSAKTSRNSSSQTIGWQFSTVVALPSPVSSWVYILDTIRIPTSSTPTQTLAAQLRTICPLLPARPVLITDRGYPSTVFLRETVDIRCDHLSRLKNNRVLYRAAPPSSGKRGRPRKHGDKFACNLAETQGTSDFVWSGFTDAGKSLTVSMWKDLHLQSLPEQSLVVIRIERPHAQGTGRDPRICWLLWRGLSLPPIELVQAWYRRRFGIEHGYRFDKQHVLWTAARVRTPEQFQRWTDLVSIVHNLIVLARSSVQAKRSPWEKSTRPVPPSQVQSAMSMNFPHVGTPAPAPQPRGKSSGRAFGVTLPPAPRYPVVYKTTPSRKKVRNSSKKVKKRR